MSTKIKVILIAFLIAVVFYFLDAFFYYLVSSDENSYLQVLFTAVPLSEVYNRFLLIVGILLLGFISSGFISDLVADNEVLRTRDVKDKSGVDTNFVSSLTYQIRTPLNAIVGFSELLKDQDLSLQSRQEYINQINSSGNNLLQLMNNLSDIIKIETNQFSIKKSPALINQIIDNVRLHFEEKKEEIGKVHLKILVKKGKSDPKFSIDTDPQRLKEVLMNLVENALKNTEKGYIEIGYVLKETKEVQFYVKDTGPGYSMEVLRDIFNRYKDFSNHQNQPFDGTALRLTISKSLVKLLGGEIQAYSDPDGGASFSFNVPYSSEGSMPNGANRLVKSHLNGSVRDHNWSKSSILIAEDVESNYIYLKEILRPTNVNLIWAQNGAEAVRHVESNKDIELVLMDILMPEMDGFEASRNIKKLRPELPVIAQTAYSLEGYKDKEDLDNFNDFLIKPIWSPQLLNAVGKYMK